MPRLFFIMRFALSNEFALDSFSNRATRRFIQCLRLLSSSADCRRVPDSACAAGMPPG
jgi:hypothetical protein